jgi:glycosyltransferase involved in cell wall biosynthesis
LDEGLGKNIILFLVESKNTKQNIGWNNKILKQTIKNIFRKCGLKIEKYRPDLHQTKVVSLESENDYKGNVLLSYVIEPFLLKEGSAILNSHTHYGESLQIVETWLNLGFYVDVISYRNKNFVPEKNYSYFVSARTNFDRIAKLLNEDCIKIVHLDTAHWLFNNYSALKRCLDLQQRKNVTLKNIKIVQHNWAIEHADYATILGNSFTIDTYTYARKPIYRLPVPSVKLYPWAENKNFQYCRNHFLWLGSGGVLHKGLDLALEAFAEMPDCHLTVCGPIHQEEDFERVYYKELYETSNIDTFGWVDISSSEFTDITNNCIGLIYPSCAEGQAGAVVTCLQAGLIPIISYESGVDVKDFGIILKNCSIEEIKNSIRMIANFSAEELKKMAHKAWSFARKNYTKEKYAKELNKIVKIILSDSQQE